MSDQRDTPTAYGRHIVQAFDSEIEAEAAAKAVNSYRQIPLDIVYEPGDPTHDDEDPSPGYLIETTDPTHDDLDWLEAFLLGYSRGAIAERDGEHTPALDE
jgi:hypothetical protein